MTFKSQSAEITKLKRENAEGRETMVVINANNTPPEEDLS